MKLKRSRRVTPAILGSVMSLMSVSLMTGCGEEEVDAAVYETVQQCVEGGQYSKEECEAGFKEAAATQMDAAPKYENTADCEAEFGPGRCQQGPEMDFSSNGTTVHHHSYVPLAAGVLIGAAVSQPLYRTFSGGRYGSFTTAHGMTISSGTGRTRIVRSVAATRPTRSTTTMRRGGFGSMSRSVSS